MKKRSLNEKITLLIFSLLFLIIIILCSKKIYSIYKSKELKAGSNQISFKESFKHMGDGWYYSISARKWFDDEIKEDEYDYLFSGCNIKYSTLNDNYALYIDSNNEEKNSKIPVSPPNLATSYKSKDGVVTEAVEQKEINKIITDNKWNRKIGIEDLSTIKSTNFDKNDIIELWNKMYDDDYKNVAGPYISLNDCTLKKENKTNSYYQVGAYISYGYIKDVRIDYVNKEGEYLTDLIENKKANSQEIELYKNICEIQSKIIETNSFGVEKNFSDIKKMQSYENLFNLLNDLEKSRGKQ